jgi:uncharacterized protein YkwD
MGLTPWRIFFIVLVLFLLLVAIFSAAPDVAQGTTLETKMLYRVNAYRVNHDLHKVQREEGLKEAAQVWTKHILDTGNMSHGNMAARLAKYYPQGDYEYWSTGELVGFRSDDNVRAMFRMWLKSAGHRTILNAKRWRDVGIDVRVGLYKGQWSYVWVIDLGRRY